jgi:hypothetical protein
VSEQKFLIRISAMCVADECDILPSAEIIVDSDFSTTTAVIIESLHKLANGLSEAIKDAPLTNVRPMTLDEIETWRDEAK